MGGRTDGRSNTAGFQRKRGRDDASVFRRVADTLAMGSAPPERLRLHHADNNADGEVMDYRSRGVSGEREGEIAWLIDDLQHYFSAGAVAFRSLSPRPRLCVFDAAASARYGRDGEGS